VTAYFDTSAFLKLILQERGSQTVERAARAATRLLSVTVVFAEAGAALAAAHRSRRLADSDYALAKRSLAAIWAPVFAIVPDNPLVHRATMLAEQEALRGYDAVHLASALELPADMFVCADAELLTAARRCGLQVVDARN
jgi:predicted nucleic acid-binding protein